MSHKTYGIVKGSMSQRILAGVHQQQGSAQVRKKKSRGGLHG